MVHFALLMGHGIEFDESFEELNRLPKHYQDEIAEVIRGLTDDTYFQPSQEYCTEPFDNRDNAWLCVHVRGWDGWYLGWYFKYMDAYSSIVVCVVVFLYRSPDEAVVKTLSPVIS